MGFVVVVCDYFLLLLLILIVFLYVGNAKKKKNSVCALHCALCCTVYSISICKKKYYLKVKYEI